MSQVQQPPATHQALVLTSTSAPLAVQTRPTPQARPGSAVVRVLAANIVSYACSVYNGDRAYLFPMPFVPGASAIGRVAALGTDATSLTVGQLVHIDGTVRARDDPDNNVFLLGIHSGNTPGSTKLMDGEWRDGTYAEYARVPLENCAPLDEPRLLNELGYQLAELTYISALLVPYGGIHAIALQPGETILIAPATGNFGGAAVRVALAFGARVIAAGRNTTALARLACLSTDRLVTVQITNDPAADIAAFSGTRFGAPDAFFDIAPPEAAASTHVRSGVLALRIGGRAVLMGGVPGDVALPYGAIMHRNLVVRGQFMYGRQEVRALIKMVEGGVLRIGEESGVRVAGTFGLGDWQEAFDVAEKGMGEGTYAVFGP
ncbi:GroES-like protein [Athelia psychrophila]|uniref:GroES-like protein n=1 Tax=Athelia psychrophila TaxID=1759441 RepID=A0A166UC13_9AGAM|nr:GroES-like protein [Fibularhizoctonia sp. CBS 109695]